jgi:hypothetical protein
MRLLARICHLARWRVGHIVVVKHHRLKPATSRVIGCPYFRLSSPKATSWPKSTSANVPRGIHIPTYRQAAIATAVFALFQCLPYHDAAAEALLRSTSRIDLDNLSASICSFAFEDGEENAPTYIVNRFRQYSASKTADIQLLDSNPIVVCDQSSRNLVRVVSPSVGDVGEV